MYNEIQPRKSFKERSIIQLSEQRSLPVNDQILNLPKQNIDKSIYTKSNAEKIILHGMKKRAGKPIGQTITNSLNLIVN